jgi:hypothetical protein
MTSPSWFARILLGAVVTVALLSAPPGLLSGRSVSAQDGIPEDLLAFGHQIASLAEERHVSELVALFAESEVTCPVDPAFPGEVCKDTPEGAVVSGYHVGRFQSQPGVVGRQSLELLLGEFIGDLAAADLAVRTIARRGSPTCPNCASVVVAERAPAQPSNVLLFETRSPGIGFEVYRVIGGLAPSESLDALLNGGPALGHHFVVPGSQPYPPSTGTGREYSQIDEPRNREAMLLVAALVVSLALLPLSRGAASFRRRRASGRT